MPPAPDAEGLSSTLHSSLLLRLQGRDDKAWWCLDQLYGPVVLSWCRGAGLAPDDAADVQQEVFQAAAAAIERFRREQPGDSFRGWLWRITQNKVRDFFRRARKQPQAAGGTSIQQRLLEVPCDPSDTSSSPASADETRDVYRRALQLLQTEFQPSTWQAFWRIVVDECAPDAVAAELGISRGAVYVAKSRVLRRFREEFGDVLAEGS